MLNLESALRITDLYDRNDESIYIAENLASTDQGFKKLSIKQVKNQYDLKQTQVTKITPYVNGVHLGLLFTIDNSDNLATFDSGMCLEPDSPFKLDKVSIQLVKDAPIFSERKIHTPSDAVDLIGHTISLADREMLCVVNLKTDGTPINYSVVSIGCLNASIMHPRELLKSSILSNAYQIILMHNHPSGDVEPSASDIAVTERLASVLKLVGIQFTDHIIVYGDPMIQFSFWQNNLLQASDSSYLVE